MNENYVPLILGLIIGLLISWYKVYTIGYDKGHHEGMEIQQKIDKAESENKE